MCLLRIVQRPKIESRASAYGTLNITSMMACSCVADAFPVYEALLTSLEPSRGNESRVGVLRLARNLPESRRITQTGTELIAEVLHGDLHTADAADIKTRSEERRVGKE